MARCPSLVTGYERSVTPGVSRARHRRAYRTVIVARMKTFANYAELAALQGQEVAVTGWRTVTQQHIDLFGQATGDQQWIHVDPVRAAAGPFGTTVAHGFFTLSLLASFMEEAFRIKGVDMAVNYGLNKVRFTAPVPVGSQLRARLVLLEVQPVAPSGLQMTWQATIEREGQDKPVCVAESLTRVYGGSG